MKFLEKVGHILINFSNRNSICNTSSIHRDTQTKIKTELAEMKTYQHSADNSKQRMYWGSMGPVYTMYYHMIENMIIEELNLMREKYLFVSHHLFPGDGGETVCRITVNNGDHDKMYRADIYLGVSPLDDTKTECLVYRIENDDRPDTIIFDDEANVKPRQERMLAASKLRMNIHDIFVDIDEEIDEQGSI